MRLTVLSKCVPDGMAYGSPRPLQAAKRSSTASALALLKAEEPAAPAEDPAALERERSRGKLRRCRFAEGGDRGDWIRRRVYLALHLN